MRKIQSFSFFLLCALAVSGQETGSLRPMPVTVDGRSCLKVENSGGLPAQVALETLTNITVTGRFYSVSGEVKYDGVEGDGYLEMWSVFPSGRYFSRGLEPFGPMGKISRSSGWRPFLLPFDRNGTPETPTRLEVNLILPGRGTVYIGPIKFSENPEWNKYGNAAGTADVVRRELYSNGWWPLLTAWKLARIGVPVILGLAGLIGWLAHQGKGRRFVMATTAVCSMLGVMAALLTVVAAAAGQPWWVWFPTGLSGLLLLAIFPLQMWRFRKRYGALELRRMASMDQLSV